MAGYVPVKASVLLQSDSRPERDKRAALTPVIVTFPTMSVLVYFWHGCALFNDEIIRILRFGLA
jgi:hypothetical protein